MADDSRPALTAHETRNRESWDAYSDEYQDRHGDQLAGSGGLAWGTYQIPEATLEVLDDVVGKDILELGCQQCFEVAEIRLALAFGLLGQGSALAGQGR